MGFQGGGQCQQQRLPVAFPVRQQKAKGQRASKVSCRIQKTIEIDETRVVEMRKGTCLSLTQSLQEPKGPRRKSIQEPNGPFEEPRWKSIQEPRKRPLYGQSQGPRRPCSSSEGSQRQEPRPSFVQEVNPIVSQQ